MGLFDSPHDADEDVSDRFRPVESSQPGDDDGDDADSDRSRPQRQFVPVSPRDANFSGTLKRAVDEEAGVVIYAYKSGNGAGLSAVPLSQTTLDIGDSDAGEGDAGEGDGIR
ncbi:hypothetical protein [Haloprofundus halobius]|uniref:hypothetical protein n=1 Tax=Haloprofundus halobius TaxID=2876194 RepID=UPI001CCE45A9|nr:hypothetical protein [Haloprofundus halobius]